MALCAAFLPLGACASGGFSLEKAEVDHSILTSNVPAEQVGTDAGRASDETTIRNAVSSADLESLAGKPVPWANPDTGSRGAIASLTEQKNDGTLCRAFTTSRESFDGVGLYKGEVCMVGAGAWRMQAFDAL
jgi:hypothetical protein